MRNRRDSTESHLFYDGAIPRPLSGGGGAARAAEAEAAAGALRAAIAALRQGALFAAAARQAPQPCAALTARLLRQRALALALRGAPPHSGGPASRFRGLDHA
ncbi:MAG TPA: hypothetical protein VEH84_00140 [Alphaproteobacteria bacterium]|nr:hypothetical protein [Alphaproteobacteria bacterium]